MIRVSSNGAYETNEFLSANEVNISIMSVVLVCLLARGSSYQSGPETNNSAWFSW